MDGRAMIVGKDYDELMAVGGEPAHAQALTRHYGAPPSAPPQGYDPRYAQHYGPPPGYQYAPPPQHFQPPQPAYQPPPPQHAPQQHQQTERHVRHEGPTRERDFPIGFTKFGVLAGDTVEIEVKPQVLFKGKRLAVGATNANQFIIVDIKVGKNSQLAATGEMGAEAFSSLAVDTKMELDTAQPGITITLRVRNIGNGPRDFFAVLYGAVME